MPRTDTRTFLGIYHSGLRLVWRSAPREMVGVIAAEVSTAAAMAGELLLLRSLIQEVQAGHAWLSLRYLLLATGFVALGAAIILGRAVQIELGRLAGELCARQTESD